MTLLLDTPSHPTTAAARTHGDPPKLSHDELLRAHAETLSAPRRRYSLAAKAMFLQMDLIYGRKRTLKKFHVLEVVARVPYQAWETASYKRISRNHRSPGLARRIWERALEFRAQQDNEQWHMLILAELVAQSGEKEGRLRFKVLPKLMAFGYWTFCWLMYAVKPTWSHRLNADFEDHAEHEYAELVRENPQFETTPYDSVVCAEYGTFASVADLLRQIGHDERCHKQESEIHLREPRVR
ncbi:MAG: alternative oxidase [Actinomycetes bacterium]